MGLVAKFIELTRGYSLLVTFSSCFVVYSYAHYSPDFTLLNFILMVIGLCLVHMGANLYDDFKDVLAQLKQGKKLEEVSFQGFRPKARLITDGTFSIKKTGCILIALFTLASIIGIYFAICSGWQILIFMLIGGLLTLLYPSSSKYNCAEIIVGLIFGPLMIMGGYFALTSEFNLNLFILSIAIMCATLTLLHVHSIMDWEFDIKDGKKTLAILSGSKQNAIKVLKILASIPYFIVLIGVLSDNIGYNPKMLYVFLTLPITTKLISSMQDYIDVKDVEFKPRWYWGFFENWKDIKERNLEFFFFRFYLARNYSFFFALFALIGVIA